MEVKFAIQQLEKMKTSFTKKATDAGWCLANTPIYFVLLFYLSINCQTLKFF